MPVDASYGDYASGEYLEYQERYASTIRESDRRLIEMIEAAGPFGGNRLLDIGCSSGNLLLHLKHQIPQLKLTGGEVFAPVVERCRENPQLAGINFEVMDLLHLDGPARFEVVVVNAVFCLLDRDELGRALAGIARILTPKGWLFAFDPMTATDQDLTVREKSRTHPEGMTHHYRPRATVAAMLREQGFAATITPFEIPRDLPQPRDPGDISSHTVRTPDGGRLIFRGGLFTPWCHLEAQKQ